MEKIQPKRLSGITKVLLLRQQITMQQTGYELYKSIFNKWATTATTATTTENNNKNISIKHRCWFRVFLGGTHDVKNNDAAVRNEEEMPSLMQVDPLPTTPHHQSPLLHLHHHAIILEAVLCNNLHKLTKKNHINRIIQRHVYTENEILQHKLFFVKFLVIENKIPNNLVIVELCKKYKTEYSNDGCLVIIVPLKHLNECLSFICGQ